MRIKETKVKLTITQVEEFLAQHLHKTITNTLPLMGRVNGRKPLPLI